MRIPNHTQTPNEFYDHYLRIIDNMAELKVTLVAIRKTFGWHKERDRISLSQFEELTGLSRPSCIDGIRRAIGRGTLERFACDNGFEYALIVAGSKESLPFASKESLPTKEIVKERNTREDFTVGDIMDGILASNGKAVDFPEPYNDYLIPFTEKFGRSPTKKEKSAWIKAASEWMDKGIKPDDIPLMYKYCRDRGTVIKSPFSITYAYDEIRTQEVEEWNPL